MSGDIPTPKWDIAPPKIREAWHHNNNASQRLLAALEIAETAIAEMRALMAANNILPEDKPKRPLS